MRNKAWNINTETYKICIWISANFLLVWGSDVYLYRTIIVEESSIYWVKQIRTLTSVYTGFYDNSTHKWLFSDETK